jgi:phosphohistidine phosphatase
MKLYVLRHGKADWPDWDKEDSLRPLTEEGVKELRRAAKFWNKIGVAPKLIITSPLPRARQTAQLAHKQIGGELQLEAKLSPGATPRIVKSLLHEQMKSQSGDLMIVGHEPDLSEIIRSFTGAHVKMSKAGLARLDFENPQQARLIWLLPPKISAH